MYVHRSSFQFAAFHDSTHALLGLESNVDVPVLSFSARISKRYMAVLTAQIVTHMYPGKLYVRSVAPAVTAPINMTKIAHCSK